MLFFPGTVTLENEDMVGRDQDLAPWLAALYVTETSRGSGLGEALLESAAALAKRLCLAQLHLWFPVSKTHLRRFYEACGWVLVEEAHYEGSSFGEKVAIMRLAL